jgi:hypothetical protein
VVVPSNFPWPQGLEECALEKNLEAARVLKYTREDNPFSFLRLFERAVDVCLGEERRGLPSRGSLPEVYRCRSNPVLFPQRAVGSLVMGEYGFFFLAIW